MRGLPPVSSPGTNGRIRPHKQRLIRPCRQPDLLIRYDDTLGGVTSPPLHKYQPAVSVWYLQGREEWELEVLVYFLYILSVYGHLQVILFHVSRCVIKASLAIYMSLFLVKNNPQKT